MLKYSSYALVVIGLFALPSRAPAEQVRFRYVQDAYGQTRQVPCGPEGAIGEKITGIGLIPKPYREAFKATHMVTFRHPYTARNVAVPMTLPANVPPPSIHGDHITYHFSGGYKIDVRFFGDGSVETIYNSGILRQVKAP